jgi:hypothetical protein
MLPGSGSGASLDFSPQRTPRARRKPRSDHLQVVAPLGPSTSRTFASIRWGDNGSGVEVSGASASVTQESRQRGGCESRHPFQPPPSPGCYWEVHELPREGRSDAWHQIGSVSSDRWTREPWRRPYSGDETRGFGGNGRETMLSSVQIKGTTPRRRQKPANWTRGGLSYRDTDQAG